MPDKPRRIESGPFSYSKRVLLSLAELISARQQAIEQLLVIKNTENEDEKKRANTFAAVKLILQNILKAQLVRQDSVNKIKKMGQEINAMEFANQERLRVARLEQQPQPAAALSKEQQEKAARLEELKKQMLSKIQAGLSPGEALAQLRDPEDRALFAEFAFGNMPDQVPEKSAAGRFDSSIDDHRREQVKKLDSIIDEVVSILQQAQQESDLKI